MLLSFFLGLLYVVLFLDCVFLLLLILIQLPKKEAGLGQAFGSGTTDALFGAGSGTALTKMTKYAAGVFFVLLLTLAIITAQQSKARRAGGAFRAGYENAAKNQPAQPVVPPAPASNAPIKVTLPNLTNAPTPVEATNMPAPKPAAPGTNPPAAAQPK